MTAHRIELLEGIGPRKTPEKPTARTGRLQRSNFCEKSGAERSSAWGEAELPSTPWRRADSGSRRIRPGPTSRSALRCGWRSHRCAQPSVPVPPAIVGPSSAGPARVVSPGDDRPVLFERQAVSAAGRQGHDPASRRAGRHARSAPRVVSPGDNRPVLLYTPGRVCQPAARAITPLNSLGTVAWPDELSPQATTVPSCSMPGCEPVPPRWQ